MEKKKSNFRDKMSRSMQRQKENKNNYGYLNLPTGVKILSLEDGLLKVDLDFLMYEVTDPKHPERDEQFEVAMPGTLWWRRPFRVHRDVGADKDAVVCPRSVGKKCPICEFREKRQKETADKEEIKLLYPRSRSLYVVVPLGVKKYDEVPTVWDMSDFLFQNLLNDELETDEENRVFPDLATGKTLTLKLKWKQIGSNAFPEVRDISFNDRDPYPESILKDVPNLDNVLKVLPYSEIENKFFDLDNEPDAGKLEASDDTHVPVHRARATVATEEAEEPEETNAPVTRKRPTERAEETAPTRARTSRTVVEDPDAEKAPVRHREGQENKESAVTSKRVATNGKCPHGHVFGKDFEKFPECDDCEKWNDCYDESKGK